MKLGLVEDRNWPHRWSESWTDTRYFRDATLFPPGTRLVVENARERTTIDAINVTNYRNAGYAVVGISDPPA